MNNETELILNFSKIIEKNKYNDNQKIEIYLGLKDGLDVSSYCNPIFDEDMMWHIRHGLKEGFYVDLDRIYEISIEHNEFFNIKDLFEIYMKLLNDYLSKKEKE